MDKKHAHSKVIDRLGGTAKVARIFNIRMPSVSNWRIDGIPRARVMYLEVVYPTAFRGISKKSKRRSHA